MTCEACLHTPHRSQYTLTTSCTASTYLRLTKCVIFSQVLIVAPWWWFSCKSKHVGAVLLILKYFNNSTFFNVACVSWKLKCWILLMHGVTMTFMSRKHWWNDADRGKLQYWEKGLPQVYFVATSSTWTDSLWPTSHYGGDGTATDFLSHGTTANFM